MHHHVPVFLNDVKSIVHQTSPGLYFDLTFGRGGYTRAILDGHPDNSVLACDLDPDAIDYGRKNFSSRVQFVHSDFLEFLERTDQLNPVGIFADLGISSPQIDNGSRGMSFRFPEFPLDLRLNQNAGKPAWEIIPEWTLSELVDILESFAELPRPHKLADRILTRSKLKPPILTGDIYSICGGNPSLTARVIQAIRIVVNQELEILDNLLFELNQPKWNNLFMFFVTFHSLEDRIVKRRAKELKWNLKIFKNSVSAEEYRSNSRSSSAKLRIYEK